MHPTLTLTQWYAVAMPITIATLLVYRMRFIIHKYLLIQYQSMRRHVVHPELILWEYRTGLTRLQAALVASFFGINGFCMGLGIHSRSDLLLRSGTMASINLIPLFLGGRTNVLANYLGITLHSYYLAHYWIGRIVLLQSVLHVGLVVFSGDPWTFNSSRISAITSASALALLFLLSLYFVRKIFEFFLKIHFILAFIALFTLIKHLSSVSIGGAIFPLIAIGLWLFNASLRLVKIVNAFGWIKSPYAVGGCLSRFYKSHYIVHGSFSRFNGEKKNTFSAGVLTIRLSRPLRILPGQYVYLFFSEMGLRRRFQAHPFMITWWDDSLNAKKISFLIQVHDGITSQLVNRNSVGRVAIDGPYGKDLQLEDYQTVILIAKGIGIAGILPYIRHMTYRRLSKHKTHEAYRRGLITRKIDIFWVLDGDFQQDWISGWLAQLQQVDSDNHIITFCCFYPEKQSRPEPVPSNKYWKFIYQEEPQPIIEDLMRKEIQRSPGKSKVTVCGNTEFSRSIRESVLKVMNNYPNVEFSETEFQPQEPHISRYIEIDDTELDLSEKKEPAPTRSITREEKSTSKRAMVLKKPRSVQEDDHEHSEKAEVKEVV